jgi:integrase
VIDDMPRDLPPHLVRQRTQHGKTVYYVRIRKGPRTRLRAPYGSEAFWAEYRAAISGDALPALARVPGAGSLAWLWERYRETGPWTTLSAATRRQRENIIRHVLAASGSEPYAKVNRESVAAGRDKRSATPSQARNFLDAMRGLFRWALEAGHVKVDPTTVKNPPKKKTSGFPAWIRADVEAYQRRWPIGTRQRVWLDVVLYTGLRRGDLVVIGKQHVSDVDGIKVASLRTEKGGHLITVTLPVLPILQATLDAGPIGDLAWICGERGHRFVKESFGNEFSTAARMAGVKKSLHGVRKIAATIAAENGATGKELDAIFGWVDGGRTSAIYTQEADRRRLAMAAMGKLDDANGRGTSAPSPSHEVRAPEPKGQLKQR